MSVHRFRTRTCVRIFENQSNTCLEIMYITYTCADNIPYEKRQEQEIKQKKTK